MGLPVIGRENPDFFALKLLCTILGGYFGSRLMSNIREEKGYTYGISSSIAAMRYGSYLTISTQTGTEFTRPLIDEVFAEIDRLRNEPVPTDEFITVQNYLRGDMARTLDSPFSIADYYLSLKSNDLPVEYFAQQDEAIRQLSPGDLLSAAQKISRPLTILHSRRRRQEQNSPTLPTLTNPLLLYHAPYCYSTPQCYGGGWH